MYRHSADSDAEAYLLQSNPNRGGRSSASYHNHSGQIQDDAYDFSSNEYQSHTPSTLDQYFKITERGSSFQTECRAGLYSFLMTSYILVINAQLLKLAGFDSIQTVVSTCVTSFLASFIIGVGGNLPFVAAPGLGVTSYLAVAIVRAGIVEASAALTCVTVVGVIGIFFSTFGLTESVVKLVPACVKSSLVVAVGIAIAYLGLLNANALQASTVFISHIDILSPQFLLVLAGLALGAILLHSQRPYALSLTIFLSATVIALSQHGISRDLLPDQTFVWPSQYLSPFANVMGLDGLTRTHILPLFGLFVAAVCDISGVMHGLAKLAHLSPSDPPLSARAARVPGAEWGFVGCALATFCAGALGSSPVVVFVESGAGVQAGGRTGLSAIVASLGFLVSMFFAPLWAAVPLPASSSVMLIVGASMMGHAKHLDWTVPRHAFPGFITLIVIAFSLDLASGIVAGSAAYFVLWLGSGAYLSVVPETGLMEALFPHQHAGGESGGYGIGGGGGGGGSARRRYAAQRSGDDVEEEMEDEDEEGGEIVDGGDAGMSEVDTLDAYEGRKYGEEEEEEEGMLRDEDDNRRGRRGGRGEVGRQVAFNGRDVDLERQRTRWRQEQPLASAALVEGGETVRRGSVPVRGGGTRINRRGRGGSGAGTGRGFYGSMDESASSTSSSAPQPLAPLASSAFSLPFQHPSAPGVTNPTMHPSTSTSTSSELR